MRRLMNYGKNTKVNNDNLIRETNASIISKFMVGCSSMNNEYLIEKEK